MRSLNQQIQITKAMYQVWLTAITRSQKPVIVEAGSVQLARKMSADAVRSAVPRIAPAGLIIHG